MSARADGLDIVTLVGCPLCGTPRPVHPDQVRRATRRRCPRCGIDAMTEAQSRMSSDVDAMAVVRLVSGDRVNATRGELTEAVRTLTTRHLGAAVIAQRLNVTRRTVERHRARLHREHQPARRS